MTPGRPYGNTGLVVPVLGLGAGQIGDERLPEDEVGRLLNRAVDLGVTLVDTARGYGASERRIGQHLGHRRDAIVISTKVGYSIPGHADWTADIIGAGIDEALRQMRTDRLDIVHLHSCPRDVLERGEVTEALARARQAGKVRAIAYSGENDALGVALGDTRFDGFMASLNVCDQRVIDEALPRLAGRGFIAKRPAANHPWRFAERPVGDYAEEYWARFQAMQPAARGLSWPEAALRFAAFVPGVSSAILGTTRIAHLEQAVEATSRGPLPAGHVASLREAFRQHDAGWVGQV